MGEQQHSGFVSHTQAAKGYFDELANVGRRHEVAGKHIARGVNNGQSRSDAGDGCIEPPVKIGERDLVMVEAAKDIVLTVAT